MSLYILYSQESKIKNLIYSYFGFNRQQRNGLVVLSGICLLLLAVRIIYPHFLQRDNILIADLPLIVRETVTLERKSAGDAPKQLFIFDPNLVTEQQLIHLGFSERTAGTFIKFRNRGFVFRKKEDVKKVYGVSDKLYASLKPFIIINTQKKSSEKKIFAATKNKIELNSADSLLLLDIKGVGPSFARRIIKYRSILGGYVSVTQLKEVYGFTEEMFTMIEPQVTVDASLITKININTDDFKTVNKHPYISYELTKLIFDKKRKEIITPETLQLLMNDQALYKKLEPYLNF